MLGGGYHCILGLNAKPGHCFLKLMIWTSPKPKFFCPSKDTMKKMRSLRVGKKVFVISISDTGLYEECIMNSYNWDAQTVMVEV